MLTIRPEQMQSLAAASTERLNRDLVEYVRQRFPTTFERHDDQYILDGIRKMRSIASHYGVERQDNVATFIDFTIMFGAQFHRADWAVDILDCKTLHGPDKMAVLSFRVAEAESGKEIS